MNLQTITGVSKSLGAVVNGGVISARPALAPQVVDGVIINAVKITAAISSTTGAFSLPVVKGSKVLIRGVDGAGREFLEHIITVSSDDTLPLYSYLVSNPPAVPASFLAHCSIDPSTGLPLWDGGPWPGSGGVTPPVSGYVVAEYVVDGYEK